MKYRYAILLFFAAFILQPTFLNLISIFGITPNLTLCLVVSCCFLYSRESFGVVLGVIFGLLIDICTMQYVGVSSIAYFLIGIAVMLCSEFLNRENIASMLLVTAVSTMAFSILTWGIHSFLGTSCSFVYLMKQQIVLVLYNVAIVAIIYQFIIRKVIRYRSDRYYI